MDENKNQENQGQENGVLSQKATELLVQSIFMKHGITKENIRPLSEEQKLQLKNLVDQFKEQAEEFINTEKTKGKKKKGKTFRKRRNLGGS